MCIESNINIIFSARVETLFRLKLSKAYNAVNINKNGLKIIERATNYTVKDAEFYFSDASIRDDWRQLIDTQIQNSETFGMCILFFPYL